MSMKDIDEYGFNKKWIDPQTQAEVYRDMVKKKSLGKEEDQYVLSHAGADPEFRYRLVQLLLKYITPSNNVISVAEGQGHLMTELIAQGISRVQGVDICRELVEIGQAQGLRLQHADATRLPFTDNTFDALIINEAIGALGLSDSLTEARRVLKPGGRIIITNYNYDEHAGQDISSPVVKYRYIPTDLIIQALKDKNFRNIMLESIMMNPLSDEPLEEESHDQMNILVAIKAEGLS